MNGDVRPAPDADVAGLADVDLLDPAQPGTAARRTVAAPVSDDSRIALALRGLVERGKMDEARERFGELVAIHQRRAARIAYQYLRDPNEADEAVQDAFVKVFSHITTYREAWPFEVWFTRILINGCLDRRKARSRRDRWFVDGEVTSADEARVSAAGPASDPEHRLLARERRARIAAAINRLDGRQRTVFMLCHYGDCTPREVSVMTGLNESTVRVHLFRAARKLRGLLGGKL
jgi:RNA polymerase sigma-70 factor (ECF subfamily)